MKNLKALSLFVLAVLASLAAASMRPTGSLNAAA